MDHVMKFVILRAASVNVRQTMMGELVKNVKMDSTITQIVIVSNYYKISNKTPGY